MCYCKYCGTEIDTRDEICSHCGKKIQWKQEQSIKPDAEGSNSSTCNYAVPKQKKSVEKICCELAYMGTLFWLPLVFCRQEKKAKYYANQGLWILILSIVSCWGIRILGIINSFLSGNIFGILYNGIYSLFFTLFLLFMIYLFINCLKSVLSIHRNEIPESILFFEERAIIK